MTILRVYASNPTQELLFPADTQPFFEQLVARNSSRRAMRRAGLLRRRIRAADVAELLATLANNHVSR
jgi:hypothetical protein